MSERCPRCGRVDYAMIATCRKCKREFCDECSIAAAEFEGKAKHYPAPSDKPWSHATLFKVICPYCGTDEVDY